MKITYFYFRFGNKKVKSTEFMASGGGYGTRLLENTKKRT